MPAGNDEIRQRLTKSRSQKSHLSWKECESDTFVLWGRLAKVPQSFEEELVQLIQDLGRDHAVEGEVEPVLRPARSVLSDSEQFIMPQGSV